MGQGAVEHSQSIHRGLTAAGGFTAPAGLPELKVRIRMKRRRVKGPKCVQNPPGSGKYPSPARRRTAWARGEFCWRKGLSRATASKIYRNPYMVNACERAWESMSNQGDRRAR